MDVTEITGMARPVKMGITEIARLAKIVRIHLLDVMEMAHPVKMEIAHPAKMEIAHRPAKMEITHLLVAMEMAHPVKIRKKEVVPMESAINTTTTITTTIKNPAAIIKSPAIRRVLAVSIKVDVPREISHPALVGSVVDKKNLLLEYPTEN